ncbi:MAG TPA: hypothetical protein VLW84_13685 [Terriglobales bacterium]|nr:hypothetical protein [Terriglobales bacterium]
MYFHQGKLFRIELDAPGSEALDIDTRRARRRLEFYWLCDVCAPSFTLGFKKGVGIVVLPAPVPVLPPLLAAEARSAAVGHST